MPRSRKKRKLSRRRRKNSRTRNKIKSRRRSRRKSKRKLRMSNVAAAALGLGGGVILGGAGGYYVGKYRKPKLIPKLEEARKKMRAKISRQLTKDKKSFTKLRKK